MNARVPDRQRHDRPHREVHLAYVHLLQDLGVDQGPAQPVECPHQRRRSDEEDEVQQHQHGDAADDLDKERSDLLQHAVLRYAHQAPHQSACDRQRIRNHRHIDRGPDALAHRGKDDAVVLVVGDGPEGQDGDQQRRDQPVWQPGEPVGDWDQVRWIRARTTVRRATVRLGRSGAQGTSLVLHAG